MTVEYCQATDIASVLQLMNDDNSARKTFDATTFPTLTEVESWIEETQDYIDAYCYQNWRSVGSLVTEEPHDNNGLQFLDNSYYARSAVVVKLRNSVIRTMASASGDKLEVWNGSSWTDLLVSGTQGVGPGDGDFYVEKKNGIIYIYSSTGTKGPDTIRVTYHFGESAVPNDLKRACILLTAIKILQSNDYVRMFPEQGSQYNYTLASKAQEFRTQAMKILQRHRRIPLIN